MTSPETDVAMLLQLWRVADRSRAHVECILQDLIETSCAQFLVLRTVASADGVCTPSDLASALRCSRANVGQIVRTLERDGRLEKRVDARDARCHSFALSRRGANAFAHCAVQLPIEAGSLFGALDGDEKAQLLAILTRLLENDP